MIFTYYYYEKSKLPKFYSKVAEKMKSFNNSVFVEDDDIKKLHTMLKKLLDTDKPVGSTAYVHLLYSYGSNSGCIYVYPAAYSSDTVLRLEFNKVAHVYRFGEDKSDYYWNLDFVTEKGGKS